MIILNNVHAHTKISGRIAGCCHADELILRQKLEDILPAISISYLSKNYFKKTPQWFYQRLNGNNVNGKEVTTLINTTLQQGEHSLPLNTSTFVKGIYFVKMTLHKGIKNEKLIVQ